MRNSSTLEKALSILSSSPTEECAITLFGSAAQAKIAIPYYRQKVTDHYRSACQDKYPAIAAIADKELDFEHFGLIISFDQQTVVPICDQDKHLEETLRHALKHFGPVFIRNGVVDELEDDFLQKNMFPGLSFHVDRGSHMENQISFFTRDPRDPEQSKPRITSTLFMSRRATCYQSGFEGKEIDDFARCSNVFLYENGSVEDSLGEVVLEQSWRADEGVGEIGLIDNKTVYHASYHRGERGYAIGTRYLY